MAFQTNIFRQGEWVTETVGLHDVLKANAVSRPQSQRVIKPPEWGVLTRTVIESAVHHWILLVHLRAPGRMEVAFVGVSTVTPPVRFNFAPDPPFCATRGGRTVPWLWSLQCTVVVVGTYPRPCHTPTLRGGRSMPTSSDTLVYV